MPVAFKSVFSQIFSSTVFHIFIKITVDLKLLLCCFDLYGFHMKFYIMKDKISKFLDIFSFKDFHAKGSVNISDCF